MDNQRRVKRKVCGMRNPQNILEVAGLRPDYIGFNFYPGSKRFVGDDFKVPSGLRAGIGKVGIFVNQSTSEVRRLCEKHSLDLIQLHGNEPVSQCQELRSLRQPLIKAFGIGTRKDFDQVAAYLGSIDYALFDSRTDQFGGSGVAFDWRLLKHYQHHLPFFLAGGIGLGNVSELWKLNNFRLYGVDINSRVESEPALKDIGKLKELFTAFDSMEENIQV